MFKAEQVDGDKDILRKRLLEIKEYAVLGILPEYFESFGLMRDAQPIHSEIMAIACAPDVDPSQFGWQQLHCDSQYDEPYSILCAVSNEYFFDMQLEDDSGNAIRVRQKLDAAQMSVIRGNIPHAGGPTTAYRLHMTVKFNETPVSHVCLCESVCF